MKLLVFLLSFVISACVAQSNECGEYGDYVCVPCTNGDGNCGNCTINAGDVPCSLPYGADFWSCCINCTISDYNSCNVTLSSMSDDSGLSTGWMWFLISLAIIVVVCCCCILCIGIAVLVLIIKGASSIRYDEIGGKRG